MTHKQISPSLLKLYVNLILDTRVERHSMLVSFLLQILRIIVWHHISEIILYLHAIVADVWFRRLRHQCDQARQGRPGISCRATLESISNVCFWRMKHLCHWPCAPGLTWRISCVFERTMSCLLWTDIVSEQFGIGLVEHEVCLFWMTCLVKQF